MLKRRDCSAALGSEFSYARPSKHVCAVLTCWRAVAVYSCGRQFYTDRTLRLNRSSRDSEHH